MARSQVAMRTAEQSDAPFLAEVWAESLRRADHDEQVADLQLIIKQAAASPEQRLLVADYDGEPAGAVLLRASTLSPVNLEPCVQAVSAQVLPQFRRRGVGRVLFEAAAQFAEELGIGHVATAVVAGSRDANRFMARLALGPYALLRVASVHALKTKLCAQRPQVVRTNARPLTSVLAVRRSLRKSQAPTP